LEKTRLKSLFQVYDARGGSDYTVGWDVRLESSGEPNGAACMKRDISDKCGFLGTILCVSVTLGK